MYAEAISDMALFLSSLTVSALFFFDWRLLAVSIVVIAIFLPTRSRREKAFVPALFPYRASIACGASLIFFSPLISMTLSVLFDEIAFSDEVLRHFINSIFYMLSQAALPGSMPASPNLTTAILYAVSFSMVSINICDALLSRDIALRNVGIARYAFFMVASPIAILIGVLFLNDERLRHIGLGCYPSLFMGQLSFATGAAAYASTIARISLYVRGGH